jgi:hypothetical protein
MKLLLFSLSLTTMSGFTAIHMIQKKENKCQQSGGTLIERKCIKSECITGGTK